MMLEKGDVHTNIYTYLDTMLEKGDVHTNIYTYLHTTLEKGDVHTNIYTRSFFYINVRFRTFTKTCHELTCFYLFLC